MTKEISDYLSMLFFRGKKEVHLVQKRNDDLTAQRQDISLGEKILACWVAVALCVKLS